MSPSNCSGCAHEFEAHEHCRPGTDCALCECSRYRSWSLLRPWARTSAGTRVAWPVRAVRQLV